MSKKNIIAGVVLVVGLAVSIYLWSTVGMGEDPGDQTVAQKMMDFTCPACKQTFQLSVADAGAMRRANNGEIVCPGCGATGAQKEDLEVVLGGGGFKDDSEEKPAEEAVAAEPAKPKPAQGGRKKINE
ncbi:MAG TPA: hypothetical protein VJZ71_14520 [Phycisphaerae bacterium]|nr:hypothetical protein [Phycisphaerae bacterium]